MSSTLQKKVNSALSSKIRVDNTEILQSLQQLHIIYNNNNNLKDNSSHSNNDANNAEDAQINPSALVSAAVSSSSDTTEEFALSPDILVSGVTSRNLKSQLNRRCCTINSSLIHSFQTVEADLLQLKQSLNSLNATAELLTTKLTLSKNDTNNLLLQTKQFTQEKSVLQEKSSLIQQFLTRFQLSEAHLAALDSPDNINSEFFVALKKMSEIKTDCKYLLHFHAGNPVSISPKSGSNYSLGARIGLDLLDIIAKKLDSAYEKLYKYVQREAGKIGSVGEISVEFIYALALLKQQPIYYNHACQEITQSRRLLLINKFLRALTKGSATSGNKPIELNAHDPIRFISDLLAFVHQQIAEEKEFLSAIFTLNNDYYEGNYNNSELDLKELLQSLEQQGISYNPVKEGTELLGNIFEGLSRPLRLRVEQALTLNNSPELAYKLVNIVQFYLKLILQHFPSDSPFNSSLLLLSDTTKSNFYDCVKKQTEKINRNLPQPSADLSSPRQITELIIQIITIANVFQAHNATSNSNNNNSNSGNNNGGTSSGTATDLQQGFAPILSVLLDPLLFMAQTVAKQSLDASDSAVYLINIYHAIITALNSFSFVRNRIELLLLEIEAQLHSLISLQAEIVMRKTGLFTIVSKIKQFYAGNSANSVPLTTIPELSAASIAAAAKNFTSNLYNSGVYIIPQSCDKILHPKIRVRVREAIAAALANDYELLYSTVFNGNNGFINPQGILPTPPQQIELLLELNSSTNKGGTISVGNILLNESNTALLAAGSTMNSIVE
jgi:hypothetical protein